MKRTGWKRFAACLLTCVMASVACGGLAEDGGYRGIDVPSPACVEKLGEDVGSEQMLVVAGLSEEATVAWVSLHDKKDDGWHMIMTTPGYIGKNGLGKTREGDPRTPVGVFRFNRAFGIADDPGCAIPYVKADNDTYWSGDPRDGYHYNELVSLKQTNPTLHAAVKQELRNMEQQVASDAVSQSKQPQG